MNTAIKSLILIVATFAAVFGVLIFQKTKVEPPKATVMDNQYTTALSQDLESFRSTNSQENEDADLQKYIHKAKVFVWENKINKHDGNKQISDLFEIYVPKFTTRCFNKLERNWEYDDLRYMSDQINHLRRIRNLDSKAVASLQNEETFNDINKIIDDWRKATNLCFLTDYRSVGLTKKILKEADKFTSDKYLSNCSILMSNLSNLRPSIAASHYRHITQQVEKMSDYRNIKRDYFENQMVELVENALTEYENNAKSLYGRSANINDLWQKARNYYDEGIKYYESLQCNY